MTSQRRLLGVAALLVIVACTRPQANPDDLPPLAPADTLSPPTTARPPTTTTLDIERTSIRLVSPRNLQPLPGYEPIPMGDWGDWYASDASENGRWLAIPVGDDQNNSIEVRLVDLEAWAVAETWIPPWSGSRVQVTDDGEVLLMSGSELATLAPGTGGTRTAIDVPGGFTSWYPIDPAGGLVRLFGSSPLVDELSEAQIVEVDFATGETRTIPLPEVGIGVIGRYEISQTETALVNADPALVWDEDRALIVHAGRDLVTEVDLASGVATDHRFGPLEIDDAIVASEPSNDQAAYLGHRRTAALSADGRILFAAGQVGDLEVSDGTWVTTSVSTGVLAIDTASWEVVATLDAQISEIALSPRGDRLLGTGYRDTSTVNEYEYESSGYFLIDAASLEVISNVQPADPTSVGYGPFSFGPEDLDLAYVTSWSEKTQIDVLELGTGNLTHTIQGRELWVLGPVGILGEVSG